MTVRSIPAKPCDYQAKSGQTYRCRSKVEWHFLTYLDLFYPAQQWAYEPQRVGGYLCDTRILTAPVVWVEVKYDGFLDSDHRERRDAVRKLDLLKRQRPADRVVLMPWGYDWDYPRSPFLLDTRTGWCLVDPADRSAQPWPVSA